MNKRILIVGAGPTGLMLGCLLKNRGIDCEIIEKEDKQSSLTKAIMVHSGSLDILSTLGLADVVIERGLKQESIIFNYKGEKSTLDFSNLDDLTYPFYINIKQPVLVDILEKYFQTLGGRVRYGVNLVHMELNGKATLEYSKNVYQEMYTYIVGCDGANSAVRKLANINFQGSTYPYSYILAEGKANFDLPIQSSRMEITDHGAISVIPIDHGYFRVAGPGPSMVQPDDFDFYHFENVLNDLGLGSFSRFQHVDSVRSYRVNERMADTLVKGNVLLCGDAGHIHSPTGGQAMNLGFADAFSLSWRLDNIDHQISSRLVEYSNERLDIARRVIQKTNLKPILDEIRHATLTEEKCSKLMSVFSQSFHKVSEESQGALFSRKLCPGARLPNLKVNQKSIWEIFKKEKNLYIDPNGKFHEVLLAEYFKIEHPLLITIRPDLHITDIEQPDEVAHVS